jgi:membrane dipeptidase
MRKILSLALCAAIAMPLCAQQKTILGTVKDLVSQAAIESVLVNVISTSNAAERYTALSDAHGNWSLAFVTDVERDLPGVPSQFTLSQNFPNPFNPSTHIQFYLPRAGRAVITVHTILGEELDRKEADVSAGLSDIEWAGKGSAGVLFYTVEFEKTRITKKMIQIDGGHHNGFGSLHTVASAPQRVMRSVAGPSDYYVIPSKFGYETDTMVVTLGAQTVADAVMETIHNRAFLFDLHNDVMEKVLTGYQIVGPRPSAAYHTDLASWKQGGLDAQMISIWIDPNEKDPRTNTSNFYQRTLDDIALFEGQIAKNPGAIEQAHTTAEIQATAARKKIAAVIGLEGGHSIEADLSKLIALYQRGVRYLTITWNNSNEWATSAQDKASATKGLTDFGGQVIRTLDSLGVIIDVSHTGIKTIEDILAITKNPIIASHSGAWALNHHYRNLTDTQLKEIAARGGVVGVVFYPPFLSSTSKATLDSVVKHIDYIKNLIGVDYVAIGSDFDGIEVWPTGLENVTKYPDLTLALLKKGYTPADVRKILGANYMRVFQAVCH